MSFKDWSRTTDSSPDIAVHLTSVATPVGGGVNNLSVTTPSISDLPRRVAYRNNLVGDVSGTQQVSVAVRFTGYPAQVGLLAKWNGLSLDSLDKAYVLEARAEQSLGVYLQLRRGPSPLGQILGQTGILFAFLQWYQLLLQVSYDSVGNQLLTVATSDVGVNPVNAPVWSKVLPIQIIPATLARNSGKWGFQAMAQTHNFTIQLDQLQISSALDSVS